MTPRGRRLAAALLGVAGLLFLGRWLALFLADRWWAASVSPAAGVVLTRRALLRLGLDVAGVTVAVVWFAAQARAVLSSITALPSRERSGHTGFRELVSRPAARPVALATALVLGLLIGSGTGEWAGPVALASHRIRLALAEPALGLDAGWYLTLLPVWLRLQAFATVVVLLTLGLVLALYLVGGAIRIQRGAAISDEARGHLGVLLACLAAVIGTSQVLAPYELAAGLPVPVAPGVAQLHRSVAFVLVGVSVAVGVLSVAWALRPLHSLAAGAWLALCAALVGAFFLLDDAPRNPLEADERAERQAFERLAYGLEVFPRTREAARLTASLWDAGVAGSVSALGAPDPAGAVPGRLPHQAGDRPIWVAVTGTGDSTHVVVVADDTTDAGGGPLTWGGDAPQPEPGMRPLLRLGPEAVRPGAPAVVTGHGAGVPVRGTLRRLVLAWALQAPVVMAAPSRVAWRLEPEGRLAHLLPFADWRDVRPWLEGGRLRWLVDGYVSAEAFPVARPVHWGQRRVAYLRPAFLGVVDAATGVTDVYIRPGAGPLALAWARVGAPLIRDADQLPVPVKRYLTYPPSMLAVQARLYASDRAAATAADTAALAVPEGAREPSSGHAGHAVVPVVDQRTGRLDVLLEGVWDGSADRLFEYFPDSTQAPESPALLKSRWQRFPFVQAVQDSVTTAGGRFESGMVRYAVTPDGLVAYQPAWGVDPQGRGAVVLLTVARGDRLGAGRTLDDAWRNSRGDVGGYLRLSGDAAIRNEALRWLAEADSALKRGDLVAFGRAFAALKAVLEGDPSNQPK